MQEVRLYNSRKNPLWVCAAAALTIVIAFLSNKAGFGREILIGFMIVMIIGSLYAMFNRKVKVIINDAGIQFTNRPAVNRASLNGPVLEWNQVTKILLTDKWEVTVGGFPDYSAWIPWATLGNNEYMIIYSVRSGPPGTEVVTKEEVGSLDMYIEDIYTVLKPVALEKGFEIKLDVS